MTQFQLHPQRRQEWWWFHFSFLIFSLANPKQSLIETFSFISVIVRIDDFRKPSDAGKFAPRLKFNINLPRSKIDLATKSNFYTLCVLKKCFWTKHGRKLLPHFPARDGRSLIFLDLISRLDRKTSISLTSSLKFLWQNNQIRFLDTKLRSILKLGLQLRAVSP